MPINSRNETKPDGLPVSRGRGETPAARFDNATRTSTVERVPDPASFNLDDCWEERWQKSLLEAATERVKNLGSPNQFPMFELYVQRAWPVRKVAQTLGARATQVYLAKHRITALLRKTVQQLEKELE